MKINKSEHIMGEVVNRGGRGGERMGEGTITI
jgi:hypothetical protein